MNLSLIKRIRNYFSNNAVVLMYHRIAEVSPDPWELAVSPANFEEQLQVLQKLYNVIPANKLVGQDKKNSVCITFDDGYNDNFIFAKPLLEKYQSPASFFIPTGFLGKKAPFWWDELASIFLNTSNLPQTLCLRINGKDFGINVNSNFYHEHPEPVKDRQNWHSEFLSERREVYFNIWARLQPLTHDVIDGLIREIKTWAGCTNVSKDFPMTENQLHEMIHSPLFDVGIHTMTHPALSCHSYEVQQAEIAGSIQYFKDNFNKKTGIMAYPYGIHNNITHSILRELNVHTAFTTHPSVVTSSSNPLLLGRFHVKNWNGEEFGRQLNRWITG